MSGGSRDRGRLLDGEFCGLLRTRGSRGAGSVSFELHGASVGHVTALCLKREQNPLDEVECFCFLVFCDFAIFEDWDLAFVMNLRYPCSAFLG